MMVFYRLICSMLIASMVLMPFSANAGMIATDVAVMSAQDVASRDIVRDFIAREDVASQLRAMGVSASTAQDRVAAMTQEDVNKLAGQIETAPAGGAMAYAVIVALIALIVAGIVYFIWQDAKATK